VSRNRHKNLIGQKSLPFYKNKKAKNLASEKPNWQPCFAIGCYGYVSGEDTCTSVRVKSK